MGGNAEGRHGSRDARLDQRPQLLRHVQGGGRLAGHIAEARRSGESELIRELASERGTGFGLTDRPNEIERETSESLRRATETLQQKTPDELESYRSFVLEVARSVASAAGGGDEAEADAMQRIQSALASPA